MNNLFGLRASGHQARLLGICLKILGHYNVMFGLEEDVKDLSEGNCEILKIKVSLTLGG
jgi:hypothetical protein